MTNNNNTRDGLIREFARQLFEVPGEPKNAPLEDEICEPVSTPRASYEMPEPKQDLFDFLSDLFGMMR